MHGRTVDRWAFLAAVVAPLSVAAALIPLRTQTANTNVALVLVLVVVAVAIPGRRAAAAVAGLSAGVWFDFFHTRPYESFTIARHNDLETTVLLLVVGVLVGELAARDRHHRYVAAAASHDVGRIHAVSELVASGAPLARVIDSVADELRDLLSLRECRFDRSFASRPGPVVERHGAITWGGLGWRVSRLGLPGREVTLVVQGQGYPFGRFILVPTPGKALSVHTLKVAVALADQVGAAFSGQAA